MQGTDNATIVRRFYTELWSTGKLDGIEGLIASDFVDRVNPGIRGIAGVKQLITGFRAAFPDLVFTVDELISQGDAVVARFTCTGTHRGVLAASTGLEALQGVQGVPPTGKQVKLTAIGIHHLADGKIKDAYVVSDPLQMLRQLGVAPMMAPAAVGATAPHPSTM